MANNGGFESDTLDGESFSRLLFSDADLDSVSVFSAGNSPRMLCFGDYRPNESDMGPFGQTLRVSQKSGVTCSDSSSASSTNNNSNSPTKTSNVKKRNVTDKELVQSLDGNATGSPAPGRPRISKRTKSNSTSGGHAKAKKEKLGERITALQQLVSPFGKTDTASVLHEAMGYIKFLQDQVQVLCSPYLQRLPSSSPHFLAGGETGGGGGGRGESSRKELRSRGLCLVPLECTRNVANDNGADFWSPGIWSNRRSASSSDRR